ncbi:MAG: M20 family metallopeptidase [Bacteroidota bacterium]
MVDVVKLTQELVAINTVNGNEAETAKFVGKILMDNGFDVKYVPFNNDETRLNIIAEKGLKPGKAPIVFTGHFDTVPIGKEEWSVNPLEATIIGDKLYGRGSTDMKAGIAAFIGAAIEAFEEDNNAYGVKFVLTANEEPGCVGANDLVASEYAELLGDACAIIVAEPTSNIPAIAHKSALYITAIAKGKTAHSSMPHLGDNAIYKVARAISKIENLEFNAEEDKLLGYPSINVGVVEGGMNLNSVPDRASFTIDVRSTSKLENDAVLELLQKTLGDETSMSKKFLTQGDDNMRVPSDQNIKLLTDEIELNVMVNNSSVYNEVESDFEKLVYKVCGINADDADRRKALPYMTDGSVLQKYYKGVPTIILGPGEASMAHKIDEYCFVDNIVEAKEIYKKILGGY